VVTGGYTHPDVLTIGVRDGWAEPVTDPAEIDWPVRQAAAAIPFEVVAGRPVNPCAKTGIRHGRNELGLWGENLMADALITATHAPSPGEACRCLLMVERGDGLGWAVPGGAAEPGETATAAALRELAEETCLVVPADICAAGEAVYVPDPRASDEAWAVTVPVAADLGRAAYLPLVTGADDARLAAWIPANDYDVLTWFLAEVHAGVIFPAHVALVGQFLAAAAVNGAGGAK